MKTGLASAALLTAALWMLVQTTACEKAKPEFECRDSIGCVDIAGDEPVKIGVLQALSGKVATLGQEQIRGIQLAMEKHHQTILNHPVALHIVDTGCSGEGGANAALKIIADPQTVAILGTTCSAAAVTASQAMSDAGLSMISGNNSAPFLTAINGQEAPNWHPGFFRTSFNEEASGKTAALYVFNELGLRTAATINDGDIYTRGLADGFERAFKEVGGRIVLSATINKGEANMQPVLRAVLDAKAQMLFFPLFQPEGNHVLLEARKTAGFERVCLMGGGALIEGSFIQDVQAAARGMYFVGPALARNPSAAALAEAFRQKFKTPPASAYYLNAYDAADLLLTTLEKIMVQDPDGALHMGRQNLREALYATRDFKGVAGVMTCDRFGDCADPVFNVLQLEDPRAGIQGLQSNVLFTYRPRKPSP
jgi:branched-chain amino acid transport system substrate-binding protein